MNKIAVFCPRLSGETEEAWQTRYRTCRRYLLQMHLIDALEFDSLELLQMHYSRHRFRRLLVAHSGYYSLEFWAWARQHHVSLLDVMMRADAKEPHPETTEASQNRAQMMKSNTANSRVRYVPMSRYGETRSGRISS